MRYSTISDRAFIGLMLLALGGMLLLDSTNLIAIGLVLLFRWRLPEPGVRNSLVAGREISHIFGGGDERINVQEFRGGQVTVVFGGSNLDLQEAVLADGKAVLDAMVVFGGLELKVPKDWSVNIRATTLFGGIDNKHRQPEPGQARGELTITGIVLCGGIDVKDQ